MRAPRGSVWRVTGIFLIAGGYVGGLIMAVRLTISGFGGLAEPTLLNVLSVPVMGMLGWVFGFGPAVGTGLLAGLSSFVIRSRGAWVASASVLGGLMSGLLLAHDAEDWALYGVIGALSALASALIALGVRPRWSN